MPRSAGNSGLLIEDHSTGLQVDGILQLLGKCLIGTNRALRVGFEIDVDFAFRYNITRLGVVFKVAAVDLIETVRVAPIHDDADVFQFSLPRLTLVPDCACGVDGKYRPSALGVRVG